jgi:hypothetical protein
MTAIEVIALIIVAVSILKLIVLAVNPRAWFNTAGKIVSSGMFSRIGLLVLLGIVLWYLLQYLSIVEIYAASAFTIIFFWLSMAPYKQKIYDAVMGEMSTGNIWKRSGLIIVVWLVLTIWVAKEIFA